MPSVRIPHSRSPARAHPEFRHSGEWLEVTFAAPDIGENEFRYSVGRRYLLVWSTVERAGRPRFVHLPRPVVPEDHIVSFVNGVVDARLRLPGGP